MSDTEIWLDRPPTVELHPGAGYRTMGVIAAAIFLLPALLLLPVAPFVAVPGLIAGAGLSRWGRGEVATVSPEGIWVRRFPVLKDEFIAWQRVDEVALPIGALRSPWLRVDGTTRVRLPLFVDGQAFADAVGIHRPDVLERTCDWILHTHHPRGRWIEGVWICDAHHAKWCGPCNADVAASTSNELA